MMPPPETSQAGVLYFALLERGIKLDEAAIDAVFRAFGKAGYVVNSTSEIAQGKAKAVEMAGHSVLALAKSFLK